MALYLGGKKVKINLNNISYKLNLSSVPPANSLKLLSSDGYILQDLNGLYLITKEDV